jgi:hypothetical protein
MPVGAGKVWHICADSLQPEFEYWKQSAARVPKLPSRGTLTVAKDIADKNLMGVKSIISSFGKVKLLFSRAHGVEQADLDLPPAVALGYPSGREIGGRFAKVPV